MQFRLITCNRFIRWTFCPFNSEASRYHAYFYFHFYLHHNQAAKTATMFEIKFFLQHASRIHHHHSYTNVKLIRTHRNERKLNAHVNPSPIYPMLIALHVLCAFYGAAQIKCLLSFLVSNCLFAFSVLVDALIKQQSVAGYKQVLPLEKDEKYWKYLKNKFWKQLISFLIL